MKKVVNLVVIALLAFASCKSGLSEEQVQQMINQAKNEAKAEALQEARAENEREIQRVKEEAEKKIKEAKESSSRSSFASKYESTDFWYKEGKDRAFIITAYQYESDLRQAFLSKATAFQSATGLEHLRDNDSYYQAFVKGYQDGWKEKNR